MRLENEKYKLIDYKITQIKLQQIHNYAGIFAIDYLCTLDDGQEIIYLRYQIIVQMEKRL
jgi:hypothetical protein